MIYALLNPKAGNYNTDTIDFKSFFTEKITYIDATENNAIETLLNKLNLHDKIVVCGGDGTLNQFMRRVKTLPNNDIFYYPTGSGNDFWREISNKNDIVPIKINEYLKNLPSAIVNGNTYPVINGVGFGIDGFCCEQGDKLRLKRKKINYTNIAIKGCLFTYKPCPRYER